MVQKVKFKILDKIQKIELIYNILQINKRGIVPLEMARLAYCSQNTAKKYLDYICLKLHKGYKYKINRIYIYFPKAKDLNSRKRFNLRRYLENLKYDSTNS